MEHSIRKDIALVIGSILLAGASLLFIGRLQVDSSTDAFMPKQAPVVQVNAEIERQFGSLDAIIVGVSLADRTVVNEQSMSLIDRLTVRLGELEHVHRVMSLTNTDHMQAGEAGFEVVPLYPAADPNRIDILESRIDSWAQVYEGDLISADRHMASLIIQPDTGISQHELDRLLDQIQEEIGTLTDREEQFSIIGLPLVKQQINRSLLSDMAILGPIVGFLIILVLLLSFRRFAGIILPLVGLLISAAISLGLMALLGITFTMATMLVPVLLLIVGSAYAIHVMSHFYEEVAHLGRAVGTVETKEIISTVVRRNRLPIIMAGATTAAGFIAQFTSPLEPFRTFGLLSAVGVVLSQLSSLYLLPAMLRITYRKGIDPLRLHADRDMKREFKGHPVFSLFERWALHKRGLLTGLSLVLFVATVLMVPTIKTGTDMIGFFHPSTKLVQDTNLYNRHMAGSGILTIMLDGKEDSAILDPQFLTTLDRFTAEVEHLEGVGKVQTVIPYLKRMNMIMNQDQEPYRAPVEVQSDFDFFGGEFGFEDDSETSGSAIVSESLSTWDPQTYNEIPTDFEKYGLQDAGELRELLAQYLLLYAGNLGPLINDDLEPSATLVTIQLHESSTGYLRTMRDTIDRYWSEYLPEDWNYAIGGGDAVSLALTDLLTKSQIYSIVGALLIVWLLVSIIFRSPTAGIVGLIPVVFALSGVFLTMGILQISLDVITSLLAALAIGIGVDYAIHFMAACRRLSCKTDGSPTLSTIMRTTGRAIVINAASVIVGFSGLIFSRFIPIRQMGILFCISMIFSALSSLTVLPMVLTWFKPKFISSTSSEGEPPTQKTDTRRRIIP